MAMTPTERLARRRAQAKARYAANPEKVRAYQRATHVAHPERKRAWYLKNAEQERAKAASRSAARYAANREDVLREQRDWRLTHKEQYRAQRRVQIAKNATKNRARVLAWNASHPGRNSTRVRAWAASHPEQEQLRKARRRAMKLKSPICDFTKTQWDAIKTAANGSCHYCGKTGKLTVDHKQPLMRGGLHTASNIVAACRSCNSRKGVKAYEEYLRCVNG